MKRRSLFTVICLLGLLLAIAPVVAKAPSQYLYVLVSPDGPAGPSAIVVFEETSRGALQQRSIHETGGLGTTQVSPQELAIDPVRRRIYAANNGDATISVFDIAADGRLEPVPGSPFPAGSTPVFLAVQPPGDRLFATQGIEIQSYAIRPGGQLVPEGTTGRFSARDLSIDSAGRNLYVADMSEGVRAYAISPSGSLTESPESPVRMSDEGRPFYLELVEDHRLMLLDVDEGFGVWNRHKFGGLDPVPGSPFPVGTFSGPFTTTAGGEYAYVSIPFEPELHGYRVDADGGMTPLPSSPFPGDYQSAALIVPPGIPRLYEVSVAMQQVNLHAIAADGSLVKIGTWPVDDPRSPNGAAFLATRWPGRIRHELPQRPGFRRLR